MDVISLYCSWGPFLILEVSPEFGHDKWNPLAQLVFLQPQDPNVHPACISILNCCFQQFPSLVLHHINYEGFKFHSSVSMWMFPRMVVPPNHPNFRLGCSIVNHPAIGVPPFQKKNRKPPCFHMGVSINGGTPIAG